MIPTYPLNAKPLTVAVKKKKNNKKKCVLNTSLKSQSKTIR